MASPNSQPGDEAQDQALNGNRTSKPDTTVGRPDVRSHGRGGTEPKRPRPAPVGPDGQPLLVREGSHGRARIIAVAVVLGFAGWILWNAARAATESPENVNLGKDLIEVSRNAVELGKRIDRDGPRLYPGLAGTQADFWLTHVNNQFFAFAARTAGTGRECNAVWRPDLGQFQDGCAPGRLYGPTGQGLPPYDAFVEGGEGAGPGEGSLYVRFVAPNP